ncbi:MAG: helix-turn-helix transcriptional regulator [Lachnospiraceae bacterium]|nr:helix-turn-helix transcriptional regulator [Lachnospiraceae bacterium]
MRDILQEYCYDFSKAISYSINGGGQEKDMADVGKNIRKIRKEKNLTQDELAEHLHCTRQTVSNYENGKSEPGIDLLIEIAGVLEVEVNDLIYGFKKKENRRKQKVVSAIVLASAIIMLIVIARLKPVADYYAWQRLILAPGFLLNMTFRPIALALLGWGTVETVTELFEIPMEKVKYKKISCVAYYILLLCLLVLTFITLWMGADLAWEWYMFEQTMKVQDSFSSSDIPHLIPEALRKVVLYTCVIVNGTGVGCYPFLGAALAACRKMKNE